MTAAEAEAAATARIFTSSPMWNITQPESSTAPSGRTTARNASPTSCRRTVGRRLNPKATTRPDRERRQRDEDGELDHGANL